MINKFLKTPVGYFCCWLIITILISANIAYLFLPCYEITSPTITFIFRFTVKELLIALFYTLLIYKDIFTAAFKKYVLRWIVGFAALILTIHIIFDRNHVHDSNFFKIPLIPLVTVYILTIAILLAIYYLAEYYLITWGNWLGQSQA
jgi:hypothetical protein